MTNRERANLGREAMAAYTKVAYPIRTPEECGAPTVEAGIGGARVAEDTDAQTILLDLLGDLMWYAKAVGLDFDADLNRAEAHFSVEESSGWDEDC